RRATTAPRDGPSHATDPAAKTQLTARNQVSERDTRQGRLVAPSRPFPRPCRAPAPGSPPMSNSTSNPVRYFGQQVRRARRAAGWTLTEFGQRIGYDPGQISRIENGKR